MRWKNEKRFLLPGAPPWMQFVVRYPALFLPPLALMLVLAWFFHARLVALEQEKVPGVFLGELTFLYNFCGVWGPSAFFVALAAGLAYLFWYYAIS